MTPTGPSLTLPRLFQGDGAPAAGRTVFETLGTARAIRDLRTDPVPAEHVEALVWAATRASSAENSQPWQFVAVTDAAQRSRIAAALAGFGSLSAGLAAALSGFEPPSAELAPATDASAERTRQAAHDLLHRLAEVPLLLFVCGRNDYPSIAPQERYLWSAVFAAAQNVVVAARALELSAVFTMLHVANPGEVRRILEVPGDFKIAAMLAVGWPARPPRPVRRLPLEKVIHHDRW